jgi:hypothetical protein
VLALMSAAGCPSGHHHVSFGDLLLHGVGEVRKSRMVGSDDLLDILRSALQLGLAGGVADVIGGQQLVDQLHFALTENFLLQTPRDDLVPFCGHVYAPFRPPSASYPFPL